MILNTQPISMSESVEYIKKSENSEIDLKDFIGDFVELNVKDAKDLRKKIRELEFIKIKEENISKIIDLMPETAEDLNKIFIDVGLDENEIQKILETVKEFK